MEALGAIRIDCDQLGHEAYQPGTVAYHRVLEEFGSGEDAGVYWTVGGTAAVQLLILNRDIYIESISLAQVTQLDFTI